MSTPLLVIAGPTASGKSRLGIELALRLNGEIVSADAFAIYRGMDIGTDTPSPAERRGVPHHLIDHLDPEQRCSAGDWARLAEAAIAAIVDRGRQPIVVGGSGLYLRALLFGLFPDPGHDPQLRARLAADWERDPTAVLHRLRTVDLPSAERLEPGDRPRILRALEVFERLGKPLSKLIEEHRLQPRRPALVLALERPRAALYARINARVDSMFGGGILAEVEALQQRGLSAEHPSLQAIGYREVARALATGGGIDRARLETRQATRRLAKRQLSWIRNGKLGELSWIPADDRSIERAMSAWTTYCNERIT